MSSYELLELLEFMPEEGALARSVRGGERPDWQLMLGQIANETSVLRASQVSGVDSDDFGSRLWIPLKRLEQMAQEVEEIEEAQEVLESTFMSRSKQVEA